MLFEVQQSGAAKCPISLLNIMLKGSMCLKHIWKVLELRLYYDMCKISMSK